MNCAGSEVRQILQGVTEWVASMVDNSADPFDDLVSLERSGELSSITAHVAETIFQMAGALDSIGTNSDVTEITYELDLGVSHFPHKCCVSSHKHEACLELQVTVRRKTSATELQICSLPEDQRLLLPHWLPAQRQ